jgi:dephospho-CoA kinase
LRIEKAIIIIGKICSGKSTLTKILLDNLPNAYLVSFSSYIKKYCDEHNISYEKERRILQEIGQDFIENEPISFLKKTIKMNNIEKDKVHIFEGVRHEIIFEEIKKISTKSISIFVSESEELRFKRFNERKREIDTSVSLNEFREKNNHKVELEIDELKKYCDRVVIPSTFTHSDLRNLFKFINKNL